MDHHRSNPKSITKRCSLATIKDRPRADKNRVMRPTSFSTKRSRLGRSFVCEEFPIDQLYDIYMQKHALEDLAFDNEFKVGDSRSVTVNEEIRF